MSQEEDVIRLLVSLRQVKCGDMPWQYLQAKKLIANALRAARANALRELAAEWELSYSVMVFGDSSPEQSRHAAALMRHWAGVLRSQADASEL
jgi:hypothetical protein